MYPQFFNKNLLIIVFVIFHNCFYTYSFVNKVSVSVLFKETNKHFFSFYCMSITSILVCSFIFGKVMNIANKLCFSVCCINWEARK